MAKLPFPVHTDSAPWPAPQQTTGALGKKDTNVPPGAQLPGLSKEDVYRGLWDQVGLASCSQEQKKARIWEQEVHPPVQGPRAEGSMPGML